MSYTKLERTTADLDDLLLDPNNARFHDLSRWQRIDVKRLWEPKVQERVREMLRDSFDVKVLKDSIETNGYVPVEQIVARPYQHQSGKYLVIEGNRRVCAMQWLVEDAGHGRGPAEDAADSFRRLDVLVMNPDDPANETAQEVLMAIRHVSGSKAWGAYQQAALVESLYEKCGGDFQAVAGRLGLKSREVARRFRAISALHQMERDSEYGDLARPEMYSIFHEAVAQPILRIKWLGWEESSKTFTKVENLRFFYSLLVPAEGSTEPQIKGYQEVRELKSIVEDNDAMAVLMGSPKTLKDAYIVSLRKLSAAVDVAGLVSKANEAIDAITVTSLSGVSEELEVILVALQQKIGRLLGVVSTLRQTDAR